MESPIRTLIVDDEPTAQEVLAEYVGRHAGLEAVGTCGSAVEAANTLRDEAVDLLLLDVEMPEMSGMELVKMMEDPPAVVLVTASEEYAVEAFELAAVDYLVKPVRYARFLEAINRVEGQSGGAAGASGPGDESIDGRDGLGSDEGAENAPADPADADPADPDPVGTSGQDGDPWADEVLFVREGDDLVRVRLADIQYVEAKGDYMLVHTAAERHMAHATMKKIEERLPAGAFMRVHRSYLVRIDQVERIEGDRLLIGGTQIPVGPTYRETLLERIRSL
ncbi:LytR/AlgR family response regulator transcription factor [Salinibacter ruber]|uniref:LytR/AlgR family response regulator transcription factor n=1 Tax=Salinibacter ruber TaxID=146919 RepID=UPI0021696BA7|nr:LytTR family DNA-binding domain-containing protein [Salinibacter ruber]MCS4117613.1 DNA-binding LytR/AlgR family response regulator [Salinibacter ruber]MCS4155921.1 DNA-binding LytR/AlgR family response regulator [Salinibacter ruber]